MTGALALVVALLGGPPAQRLDEATRDLVRTRVAMRRLGDRLEHAEPTRTSEQHTAGTWRLTVESGESSWRGGGEGGAVQHAAADTSVDLYLESLVDDPGASRATVRACASRRCRPAPAKLVRLGDHWGYEGIVSDLVGGLRGAVVVEVTIVSPGGRHVLRHPIVVSPPAR